MIFCMKNLMDLKKSLKERKCVLYDRIHCLHPQSGENLFNPLPSKFYPSLQSCWIWRSSCFAIRVTAAILPNNLEYHWLINWIILGLSFFEYDNESILQTHLYFFNLHLAPCGSREKGGRSLFWILGILSSWRSARAARHPTDVIGPEIQRDDV